MSLHVSPAAWRENILKWNKRRILKVETLRFKTRPSLSFHEIVTMPEYQRGWLYKICIAKKLKRKEQKNNSWYKNTIYLYSLLKIIRVSKIIQTVININNIIL